MSPECLSPSLSPALIPHVLRLRAVPLLLPSLIKSRLSGGVALGLCGDRL